MKLIIIILIALQACIYSADRPNILVVTTDDQRHDMLGCVSPFLHTPNMDFLAKNGVRFKNAFVTTPICMASRASILTGLVERTHNCTFKTPPLKQSLLNNSYPALLKKSGYQTAYIGKFGVTITKGATNKIYDYFKELKVPYFQEIDGKKTHLTDYAAELTNNCINEFKKSDSPWCITVGFNAPHAEDLNPLQYVWPNSADKLYSKLWIPAPPLSNKEFYNNLHPYLRDGTMNRDRWQWRFNFGKKQREMTKGYYRMISGVDHALGKIIQSLKDSGEYENTVILFIGDNGYFLGERGYAGKWLPYEQSIRVPMIMFDPKGKYCKKEIHHNTIETCGRVTRKLSEWCLGVA